MDLVGDYCPATPLQSTKIPTKLEDEGINDYFAHSG